MKLDVIFLRINIKDRVPLGLRRDKSGGIWTEVNSTFLQALKKYIKFVKRMWKKWNGYKTIPQALSFAFFLLFNEIKNKLSHRNVL